MQQNVVLQAPTTLLSLALHVRSRFPPCYLVELHCHGARCCHDLCSHLGVGLPCCIYCFLAVAMPGKGRTLKVTIYLPPYKHRGSLVGRKTFSDSYDDPYVRVQFRWPWAPQEPKVLCGLPKWTYPNPTLSHELRTALWTIHCGISVKQAVGYL